MPRTVAGQKGEKTEVQDSLSRLRGNSIFLAITLVYLFALGAAFYSIETFYLQEKWEIVQEKLRQDSYLQTETGKATAILRSYIDLFYDETSKSPQAATVREERLARLKSEAEAEFRKMIEESPVIVSMEVRTRDDKVLIQEDRWERRRQQHDFSNSLLTRTFTKQAQQTYQREVNGDNVNVAFWRIYVTTARNDLQIEALTARYWKILLITFAILTVVYYVLLRFTFLPLRRVVLYMQSKDVRRSPIIPHPANLLELEYNNLARDAALTRLSKELRERISVQGLSYADPILEQVPDMIHDMLAITTSQVWTFHRRSEQNQRWESDHFHSDDLPWLDLEGFRSALSTELNAADPLRNRELWTTRLLERAKEGPQRGYYFCDVLDAREEHLWVFIIHIPPDAPVPNAWWLEYYQRVAQELRYALNSVEDQRRLILQEKSKANISLSRNLGHDLTNIIATTKLELMTVRAILAQGPEALQKSKAKETIFQEALQALLNNTRFLQEIVNLYRSFSYLQKPKFETVDVGELVNDVAELYRLTLSSSFRIKVNVRDTIPPARVEPRLLRLALFNILTNAVDAIKRSGSTEKPDGEIHVLVGMIRNNTWIEMLVSDTGPGIRDAEGKLLTPDQLSEIFRLGYTTKANQEGEGLGLNWVQSIVREFHGGEVAARNREEGGASFIIRIPVEHQASPAVPEQPAEKKEPALAGADKDKG
jgi:signal transduction histidine kinase